VARDKGKHQEICSRIYKVLTEQSTTPEKVWKASSIRNTRRIIAGNQHQCYWTITTIKEKRHYCGNHRLIHKNDMTQDNNNDSIITGNCENLLRQNLEAIWNTKEGFER